MRALSIRQPYAELILRGEKTVEYRTIPTRIIGERFYVYASKGTGNGMQGTVGNGALTPALSPGEREFDLPTGVIVGSAVISHCTPIAPDDLPPDVKALLLEKQGSDCETDRLFEWHLTDVQRLKRPRKPKGHPQPVWFRPF